MVRASGLIDILVGTVVKVGPMIWSIAATGAPRPDEGLPNITVSELVYLEVTMPQVAFRMLAAVILEPRRLSDVGIWQLNWDFGLG